MKICLKILGCSGSQENINWAAGWTSLFYTLVCRQLYTERAVTVGSWRRDLLSVMNDRVCTGEYPEQFRNHQQEWQDTKI